MLLAGGYELSPKPSQKRVLLKTQKSRSWAEPAETQEIQETQKTLRRRRAGWSQRRQEKPGLKLFQNIN